ncbi:MAG: alanine racemase [Alphaproteobacteria bacterium]|nr:alanine racemase [Alphaproteobacteria bacterium]
MATLSARALQNNSAWMQAFLQRSGVEIAPHGKTTMAPSLFAQQIRDGAWGIAAANIQHVRAYRTFGVNRIFLANQVVDEVGLAWLLREHEADHAFELYTLIDSVVGIEAIERAFRAVAGKRPLKVLLEVGHIGGRAGVRSFEQGMAVARAAARSPALELCGVETFEGLFQTRTDGQARAEAMLDLMCALVEAGESEALFGSDLVLSAGGSGFFDLAARALQRPKLSRPARLLLRSGCYLTHDDGMYRSLFSALQERSEHAASIPSALVPALHVWAQVQSCPEPGRVICAFGRRDVGADAGMPEPMYWVPRNEQSPRPAPAGHSVTALNDQHAFLQASDASPLQPGDLLGFGISHPCTTFDKWRALLVVDETGVIIDIVRTYF